MLLARATRSGVTPRRCEAPAYPAVRPVFTSSNTNETVGVALGADAGEVALVGDDDADVLEHRLHEHAGDVLAVLGEDRGEALEVVVGTTWTVPASTSNGVTGVGASSGPASATDGFTDTCRRRSRRGSRPRS